MLKSVCLGHPSQPRQVAFRQCVVAKFEVSLTTLERRLTASDYDYQILLSSESDFCFSMAVNLAVLMQGCPKYLHQLLEKPPIPLSLSTEIIDE